MNFFNKDKINQADTKKKKDRIYTLLLVDDEGANLRFLSDLLENDYNILTANDGQEAIDLINNHPSPRDIHLIISDQRMPKKTGVEFLKETIDVIPNTIRIILTGYTDIDVVIGAINAGKVYKFLAKPIESDDLLITIKRALEAFELERTNNKLMNELKELNASLELKVEERTRELQSKNSQLELLNQEKNEFLGIASHDLKNPLSGILGNAAIVKEFGYMQEDMEDFIATVEKAGNQMLEMINNLLDVNSFEEGKTKIIFQTVNIAEIISEVLSRFKIKAQTKGINLHYPNNGTVYQVNVDRGITFQVLDNIISNAIKFSEPGKTVEIILEKKDDNIIIGVKDEGPGLTDEDKAKLFSKFARLSAKPTAGENSTGLGLSIVKKLTEAMNGKVWCESEAGKGSVFYVSFPEVNIVQASKVGI